MEELKQADQYSQRPEMSSSFFTSKDAQLRGPITSPNTAYPPLPLGISRSPPTPTSPSNQSYVRDITYDNISYRCDITYDNVSYIHLITLPVSYIYRVLYQLLLHEVSSIILSFLTLHLDELGLLRGRSSFMLPFALHGNTDGLWLKTPPLRSQ